MSIETNPPAPSTAPGAASRRGERLATLGTVVSGILASSCCWVPLLLVGLGFLGVSTGGVARTLKVGLVEYRTTFIAVTFAFLALAFYLTYRPRRAAAGGGGEDCWQTTAKSGGRRFSMMTVNKIMLWIVAVMAVAFLFFPQAVMGLLPSGGDDVITPEMATAVLRVDEGLTWPTCVPGVRQAIRSAAPGVLAVNVDYETKLATIGTAKEEPLPREEILAALKRQGYSGQWVEE